MGPDERHEMPLDLTTVSPTGPHSMSIQPFTLDCRSAEADSPLFVSMKRYTLLPVREDTDVDESMIILLAHALGFRTSLIFP